MPAPRRPTPTAPTTTPAMRKPRCGRFGGASRTIAATPRGGGGAGDGGGVGSATDGRVGSATGRRVGSATGGRVGSLAGLARSTSDLGGEGDGGEGDGGGGGGGVGCARIAASISARIFCACMRAGSSRATSA